MRVTYFVNPPADCIEQCGQAANLILLLRNNSDRFDVDTVVEQFIVNSYPLDASL